MPTGEVILYQTANDGPSLEVKLERETLWLSLNQIADLFERDKSVISRHLKNVFDSDELARNSVVAFFATTARDGKIYQVEHFNLDAILSVGYRVNSQRGTQFRQWASRVLREYLVKGYAVNQQRLAEEKVRQQVAEELKALLALNGVEELGKLEQEGLKDLLSRYAKTMGVLTRFDDGKLAEGGHKEPEYIITTDDCLEVVRQLKTDLMAKGEASDLFGHQKDKSFDGVIGAVNQSVFGEDAYPTVEEKAAHLLYFIIKNHPFNDDKRARTSAKFAGVAQAHWRLPFCVVSGAQPLPLAPGQ